MKDKYHNEIKEGGTVVTTDSYGKPVFAQVFSVYPGDSSVEVYIPGGGLGGFASLITDRAIESVVVMPDNLADTYNWKNGKIPPPYFEK